MAEPLVVPLAAYGPIPQSPFTQAAEGHPVSACAATGLCAHCAPIVEQLIHEREETFFAERADLHAQLADAKIAQAGLQKELSLALLKLRSESAFFRENATLFQEAELALGGRAALIGAMRAPLDVVAVLRRLVADLPTDPEKVSAVHSALAFPGPVERFGMLLVEHRDKGTHPVLMRALDEGTPFEQAAWPLNCWPTPRLAEVFSGVLKVAHSMQLPAAGEPLSAHADQGIGHQAILGTQAPWVAARVQASVPGAYLGVCVPPAESPFEHRPMVSAPAAPVPHSSPSGSTPLKRPAPPATVVSLLADEDDLHPPPTKRQARGAESDDEDGSDDGDDAASVASSVLSDDSAVCGVLHYSPKLHHALHHWLIMHRVVGVRGGEIRIHGRSRSNDARRKYNEKLQLAFSKELPEQDPLGESPSPEEAFALAARACGWKTEVRRI